MYIYVYVFALNKRDIVCRCNSYQKCTLFNSYIIFID